jgi:hypothetical protein
VNFWKVILATLVIFMAGLVTGALGVKLLQSKPSIAPRPLGAGVPRPPGLERMNLLRRMAQQLDLREDQRKNIAQILRESESRVRELWEPIAPDVQAESARVRERIRQVLTPDQRKKFEELLKQRGPGKPDGAPAHEDRRKRDGWGEDPRGHSLPDRQPGPRQTPTPPP